MQVERYYGYDDLPADVKEIEDPPYSKHDYYGYLVIRWSDASIEVYTDQMESEDARFHRDLSWIMRALGKAYKQGHADCALHHNEVPA